MKILPLDHAPPAHLAACLALVEARDPLVPPTDPTWMERGEGLVAMADPDQAQAALPGALGHVLGVGWRMARGGGVLLEIRVPPGRRRRGVGSALLDALTDGVRRPCYAGCDAGHPRVTGFLSRRGFEPDGATFHLRWDGVLEDVPRGFPSARLRPIVGHPELADEMARFMGGEVWPPLYPVLPAAVSGPGGLVIAAELEDRRVGLVAAHRVDTPEPLLQVDAMAVDLPYRARGIGRAMLVALMAAAAEEDRGVVMKISALEDGTLRWAQGLGFWASRSWRWFRRT